MVRATKVLLDGYGVPESLRWHQGVLYFVDMATGTLHRWTKPGGEEVLGEIPGRAGGLGFLPNGDMLIVSMDQHVIWRRSADGELTQHADISEYCGGHANDMMVTSDGYAYVGNFGFDYHAFHRDNANSHLYKPPGPPSTRVVCIAPDGTVAGTGPDMLFPNGTVQLPGGSVVVAETIVRAFKKRPLLGRPAEIVFPKLGGRFQRWVGAQVGFMRLAMPFVLTSGRRALRKG